METVYWVCETVNGILSSRTVLDISAIPLELILQYFILEQTEDKQLTDQETTKQLELLQSVHAEGPTTVFPAIGLTLLTGQFKHSPATAVIYVSTGHEALQIMDPGEEVWPLGHFKQLPISLIPTALLKVPAGQFIHWEDVEA
jgi:hypothetical protein